MKKKSIFVQKRLRKAPEATSNGAVKDRLWLAGMTADRSGSLHAGHRSKAGFAWILNLALKSVLISVTSLRKSPWGRSRTARYHTPEISVLLASKPMRATNCSRFAGLQTATETLPEAKKLENRRSFIASLDSEHLWVQIMYFDMYLLRFFAVWSIPHGSDRPPTYFLATVNYRYNVIDGTLKKITLYPFLRYTGIT